MRMTQQSGAAQAVGTSSWLVPVPVALAVLAAIIFLLHPSATHAAKAAGPVVSTAGSSLGRVLVDSRGRTLYLFEKDRNGKSACSGKCASFWPPLIASGKPRAAAGAKASLIGTTKRADGRMQVTYDHHPLYAFVKDTKKGQTKGEGVNAFGAEWYAVSPGGAKVDNDSSSGGSYSSGGSSGY
jgi:predicted lipoprotein with Yx(FWY)xxD motif